MRARIKVEGLRELRRDFKKAGDKDSLDAVKAAHKDAAEIVVQRAIPNVPVLSGKLLSTVKAMATPAGGRARAGTGARTPYAAPIHYGWPAHAIERRPFLLNALKQVEGQVERIFLGALEDNLEPLKWR